MSETSAPPRLPGGPGTGNHSRKADQKVVLSLAAAALLLVLVTAGSLWAFRQIETASDGRRHTAAVIASAHSFLSEIRDAETGERGFALTGDEAFLAPYTKVLGAIGGHLADLRERTKLAPAHDRLDAMLPLVEAKMAELATVIELRRRNDMRAVVSTVAGGEGKRLMESIRAEMDSFIALEGQLLAQQDQAFESNMARLFAIIVSACLFTLLLALAFAYLAYREAQSRVRNLVHLETQHLLDVQEDTNRQLLRANATLQESEEKLAVTLNSIGDAVIATDAEGRVRQDVTGFQAPGHPAGGRAGPGSTRSFK